MILSAASFFSSFVAILLLTLILLVFLQSDRFISSIGLKCMYLFALLIVFRGLLPVEFSSRSFPLTRTIYFKKLLPDLRDIFLMPFYETHFMSLTPAAILAGIWLIGSLTVLGLKVYRYYQCRDIAVLLPEITDPTVTEVFQRAKESVFPKGTVNFRLVQFDCLPTPALWGLWHPVILLPDIDYTEEELHCVFLHELFHYKQCHFLLKILLDLLTIIQWWNPVLIFYLLPAIHQIQELSVDAQLTQMTTQSQKTAYLASLTKTLQYAKKKRKIPKNMEFALLSYHKEPFMLQRFRCIMTNTIRQSSKWGKIICLSLFILSFAFVFEISYPLKTDEYGNELFINNQGQTYYIRNGDKYDLYMENQYVYTTPVILDTFSDIPIYNTKKEVHKN